MYAKMYHMKALVSEAWGMKKNSLKGESPPVFGQVEAERCCALWIHMYEDVYIVFLFDQLEANIFNHTSLYLDLKIRIAYTYVCKE